MCVYCIRKLYGKNSIKMKFEGMLQLTIRLTLNTQYSWNTFRVDYKFYNV